MGALGRTLPVWATVRPDKADMTHMFGHIPKAVFIPSLDSLFALLEREKRGCDEFFSLHKSGEKPNGPATTHDFRVVSRSELIDFVRWDVYHNTPGVPRPLFLGQGDRGVSIGGHLSAQLAELWALARELNFVFGEWR